MTLNNLPDPWSDSVLALLTNNMYVLAILPCLLLLAQKSLSNMEGL